MPSLRPLNLLALPLLLSVASAQAAQKPELLADLRRDAPSMSNFFAQRSPNRSYCVQRTVAFGSELYRFGSSNPLLDIEPGPASSFPSHLVEFQSKLYFSATNSAVGRQLWMSDGTSSTTQRVTSLGVQAGVTLLVVNRSDTHIFFLATTSAHGKELRSWDGTTLRTYDVVSGSASSFPSNVTPVGDNDVVFSARNTVGIELYLARPNGTWSLLKDIHPGTTSSGPSNMLFARSSKKTFFVATDPTNGRELWVTDGTTAGTVLVRNIRSGTNSSNPADLTVLRNGVICFRADGGSGFEPWRSDGTTGGTFRLRDIQPGFSSSDPRDFFTVGLGTSTRMYFSAQDPTVGRELFVTDGTTAGTQLAVDLAFAGGWSSPIPLWNSGSILYFSAFTRATGRELFKTNGIDTRLVADIRPGPASSSPEFLVRTDNGDTLHWIRTTDECGTRIHRVRFDTITPSSNNRSSAPNWFCELNDRLFFAATDCEDGDKLFVTDGTQIGTRSYRGFTSSDASPQYLCRLGKRIVFSANSSAGRELWATTGGSSSSDTTMLDDYEPGSRGSFPRHLASLGNKVGYIASRRNSSNGQWRDELRLLSVVNGQDTFQTAIQFPEQASPRDWNPYIAPVGSSFVFANPVDGEIWISSGTTTRLLSDLDPILRASPAHMTPLGDKVVFAATTLRTGRELYVTEGSSATTRLLKDIARGGFGSFPFGLVAKGDKCYFFANSDEIWETDGTARGTVRVVDTNMTDLGSLTPVGSRHLLFHGAADFRGVELWRWDGQSLTRVSNLTGVGFASPAISENGVEAFPTLGDRVFMKVMDYRGEELWLYRNGATTWSGGPGCGTATRVPRLSADDPVIGTTQRITTENVQTGSLAALFLGYHGETPLATGCTLWLHRWRPWFMLDVWSQTSGSRDTSFAIPNEAALEGLRLAMQVVVAPTNAPAGFDLSNSVRETLGF